MTNHTVETSLHQHAGGSGPEVASGTGFGPSLRNASLIAGVAILLLSVLAVFGNFVAVQGLVTQGDAAQTARDIMGSQAVFRLGIVSLLLVVALDVVVAWALYRVFTPVSRSISVLAAVLRLVYAGVFMVAISQLIAALHLLGNDPYLSVFTAGQLQAQALTAVTTYKDMWAAGLVLFGLHLLVIGYLALRSGFVPRSIGVLLAVAGLGYVIDSFAAVLSGGSWTEVSSFTFVGEFLLALWLVTRGRRLTLPEPLLPGLPIAVAR